MGKRKTQEEDDVIIQSIESVADNLANGVNDLQKYLLDLRSNRKNDVDHLPNEQRNTQYG